MFKQIKLRTRLLFLICSISILGFALTIGGIAIKAKKSTQEISITTANETAYRYRVEILSELEKGMDAAKNMASSFEGLIKAGHKEMLRESINEILIRVLKKNNEFIGVWTAWEPNALDGLDAQYAGTKGHDETGRFIPYWNRGSGKIIVEPLMFYTTPGDGDYYLVPLQTGKEVILEPYSYEIAGKNTFITTLATPIIVGGKTLGVVGVDFALDAFQDIIEGITPFETGYGALFSHEGLFVAHPKKELVGKDLADFVEQKIVTDIKNGRASTLIQDSAKDHQKSYIHFVPIQIGKTATPWSLAIVAPLKQITKTASEIIRWAVTISAVAIVLFVIAIFFLANSIVRPIKIIVKGMEDIAQGEGDLTARLAVNRKDEIGDLAHWFNTFIKKMHNIILQVQANIVSLNISVDQLNELSQTIASGSDTVYDRSSSVAAAAEEMHTNLSTVAAASEEASVSVNMVASATEEMSVTVSEISTNTDHAREVTENAVQKTNTASSRVNELGQAAQEISKVTETITEISEQTNLLALNATIEAARAGEAGKGFAVVANEIKELAKQTAEATLEIREKISAIQSSTNTTVSEMGEINVVINEVNGIVTTITDAVKEQASSTEEIASNVSQAAQGIAEVNENVSQSSMVSSEISKDISNVSTIANSLKQEGDGLSGQAKNLAVLSGKLTEIVQQFKM